MPAYVKLTYLLIVRSSRLTVLALLLANVLAWSVAWSMLVGRGEHHAYQLTPTEVVCIDAAGWLECVT